MALTLEQSVKLLDLAGDFCRVDDLAAMGFGERKALYDAVKRGEIPSVRIGRKVLIPTSWAREAMRV